MGLKLVKEYANKLAGRFGFFLCFFFKGLTEPFAKETYFSHLLFLTTALFFFFLPNVPQFPADVPFKGFVSKYLGI